MIMATPVAVIGAGVMGAGIAQVLAIAGCEVQLHDVDADALARGLERLEHGRFGLRAAVARGKLAPEAAAAALGRIRGAPDLVEACTSSALVIEAVPEDLALKCKLFQRIDELAPADAVLASNTAGLPITALAWATRRPGKVIGWHWAQPTSVMAMAEIIVHPDTLDGTRDLVCDLARRCGKNPVVVRDQPRAWGFVANRINAAVRAEARRVVDEGIATEEQVDVLMRDCFRWPMGPFELMRPRSLR